MTNYLTVFVFREKSYISLDIHPDSLYAAKDFAGRSFTGSKPWDDQHGGWLYGSNQETCPYNSIFWQCKDRQDMNT